MASERQGSKPRPQPQPQPRQENVGTTGDWAENPNEDTVGPVRMDAPSAEELGQAAMVAADQAGNRNEDVSMARTDKFVHERWPELNDDDLNHLPILRPGADLEQGSVYFDLNKPERGAFKAIGGQTATDAHRYVAKRQVDPYLWNRIVPEDEGQQTEPRIERPAREDHGVANEAEQG